MFDSQRRSLAGGGQQATIVSDAERVELATKCDQLALHVYWERTSTIEVVGAIVAILSDQRPGARWQSGAFELSAAGTDPRGPERGVMLMNLTTGDWIHLPYSLARLVALELSRLHKAE